MDGLLCLSNAVEQLENQNQNNLKVSNHNEKENEKENEPEGSKDENNNCADQTPQKTNLKQKTSDYRGVSKCSKDGRWQARIRTGKVVRYLGRYKTQLEAARAYDLGALKYHGVKAVLNFNRNDYFPLGINYMPVQFTHFGDDLNQNQNQIGTKRKLSTSSTYDYVPYDLQLPISMSSMSDPGSLFKRTRVGSVELHPNSYLYHNIDIDQEIQNVQMQRLRLALAMNMNGNVAPMRQGEGLHPQLGCFSLRNNYEGFDASKPLTMINWGKVSNPYLNYMSLMMQQQNQQQQVLQTQLLRN